MFGEAGAIVVALRTRTTVFAAAGGRFQLLRARVRTHWHACCSCVSMAPLLFVPGRLQRAGADGTLICTTD